MNTWRGCFAISFLPFMLASNVLLAGALHEWVPLLDEEWRFPAFIASGLGYVVLYLSVRCVISRVYAPHPDDENPNNE